MPYAILLDNESLARIGCLCLVTTVSHNATQWTHEQWGVICLVLRHLVQHSVPREVLQFEKFSASAAAPSKRSRSGTEVRILRSPASKRVCLFVCNAGPR